MTNKQLLIGGLVTVAGLLVAKAVRASGAASRASKPLSQTQTGASPQAGRAPGAATATPVAPATDPVPYRIDLRPIPADDKIETLAPKQVGVFQRGRIDDARVESGNRYQYVHYTKPGEKSAEMIVIGIFVHPDATSAQKAMASQENILPTQQHLQGDTSYYRNPGPGESEEFYYTRGRFGFLVQSFSGEEDLDAFLEAFPY